MASTTGIVFITGNVFTKRLPLEGMASTKRNALGVNLTPPHVFSKMYFLEREREREREGAALFMIFDIIISHIFPKNFSEKLFKRYEDFLLQYTDLQSHFRSANYTFFIRTRNNFD